MASIKASSKYLLATLLGAARAPLSPTVMCDTTSELNFHQYYFSYADLINELNFRDILI